MSKEQIEKFISTFLYVLSEVGGKPNIGETVLHKLMYFIDSPIQIVSPGVALTI